ncbi:MAG: NAD(P)-dependent alcohol dehydrogenase [Candidatus Limnocylindrales bacterium]
MQAIVQDRYGSADVLELNEVEKPTPREREVLVRVRAAGVNALDWHFMRGSPFVMRPVIGLRRPKPARRGVDVAGTVDSVGTDVTQFRPGDEVFGLCSGAFAEFVCAGEERFVAKPTNLSFEQAAAVPLAAMTALQGLRDAGRLRAGQRVLIIGASGGVGTFAVQIAKALGAEVTGVCSGRNRDLVRSLGADHVIDYTTEDFTRSRQRYDLIFELAGTRSSSDIRRALTPGGTLVLSSGAGGRWLGPLGRMVKAMVLSRFVRERLVVLSTTENNADLVVLKDFIEAGKVSPVIDRRYRLGEAPAAIRYVESGHTQGKTVITA